MQKNFRNKMSYDELVSLFKKETIPFKRYKIKKFAEKKHSSIFNRTDFEDKRKVEERVCNLCKGELKEDKIPIDKYNYSFYCSRECKNVSAYLYRMFRNEGVSISDIRKYDKNLLEKMVRYAKFKLYFSADNINITMPLIKKNTTFYPKKIDCRCSFCNDVIIVKNTAQMHRRKKRIENNLPVFCNKSCAVKFNWSSYVRKK